MQKSFWLGAAIGAGALIGALSIPAIAQPYGQRQYDPLENLMNRLDRDTGNRALSCSVSKRINRQGELVWLRMDCRAP